MCEIEECPAPVECMEKICASHKDAGSFCDFKDVKGASSRDGVTPGTCMKGSCEACGGVGEPCCPASGKFLAPNCASDPRGSTEGQECLTGSEMPAKQTCLACGGAGEQTCDGVDDESGVRHSLLQAAGPASALAFDVPFPRVGFPMSALCCEVQHAGGTPQQSVSEPPALNPLQNIVNLIGANNFPKGLMYLGTVRVAGHVTYHHLGAVCFG